MIRHAYTPEALFERFHWHLRQTYVNRFNPPLTRARLNAGNLRRAVVILAKLFARVGDFIAVSLVAHHMISFAHDCTEGRQNASFYADRSKAKAPPSEQVAA